MKTEFQTKPIMTNFLNLDGNWGPWVFLGQCSVSCGTGTAHRYRMCNNPHPGYGGKDCNMNNYEYEDTECVNEKCPQGI